MRFIEERGEPVAGIVARRISTFKKLRQMHFFKIAFWQEHAALWSRGISKPSALKFSWMPCMGRNQR
jgi:hypothetical protein